MLKTTKVEILCGVLAVVSAIALYVNYDTAKSHTRIRERIEVSSAETANEIQQGNEIQQDNKENVSFESESAVNNQQETVPQTEESNESSEVCCADNAHIVSTFESSYDSEGSYDHNAAKVFDDDFKSCWSEGVQGDGVGEYIGAKFDGKKKISGLKIWIGHQKSEELFYNNSVPLSFRVIAADGSSVNCQVQDVMGEQTVTFNEPLITDEVKIVIDNVREGTKWQDTCITEVRFF